MDEGDSKGDSKGDGNDKGDTSLLIPVEGAVTSPESVNLAETGGNEEFSDEGDEKEEEVVETLRFHVPLEDCIDFRVITQTQVPRLPLVLHIFLLIRLSVRHQARNVKQIITT